MLGLAEQVGGAHFHVGGIVGNDQGFSRSGQQVDADAAEQLALGLRHIGVAGADQHIDRRDRRGAECHRRDCLHAAEQIDLIRPAERHRRHRGSRRHAVQRRRAGDDAGNAGHFRGQHAHVRRGDHRVAPARHVAADAADRNVLVAQPHARQGFDFDVVQRGALGFGETADLGLSELDVLDHLGRKAGDQRHRSVRATGETTLVPNDRISPIARARRRRRAQPRHR